MIDPMISLAFSVHQNKGVYALLLGSGVSRSAAIPTGWEVILDLTRKVAHLKGEDCEPDPVAWYVKTFQEEPNYSKLLDALAKSQTERNQLLRGYFEPTDEERDQGLKLPTPAHLAIADLVATGHIKVIVTTNFDRLLERALEAVGVVPTVISTSDAIQGARPLQHTDCTIVKLHGDFLDTRIKNTTEELEQYDDQVNALLDRVFDEYGLIVCGWSAEWDIALRGALEGCGSHRFTTFWTIRDKPREAAAQLIALRKAQVVKVRNADSFFQDLVEKVRSLEDLERAHPLSVKIAVATVKRHLADDTHRIRLHDLVMEEVTALQERSSEEYFPVAPGAPFTGELLAQRMARYEALTEILRALMATGCFWSEPGQVHVWVRCLERIANPGGSTSGLDAYLALKRYPALLLLYSGGLAALAADRYHTLAALFAQAKAVPPYLRDEQPLVLSVNTNRVMPYNQDDLTGRRGQYTPLSNHLCDFFREPLKEFVAYDGQYSKLFDRFEYFLALSYAHFEQKLSGGAIRAPLGCFLWRDQHIPGPTTIDVVDVEITDMGENWPLLKEGLFDRSLERLREVKAAVDNQINGRRNQM